MATYKVGADGKAPPGLSIGDYVVTGGGTYEITFVNPNGTYKSQLVNSAQTTYNNTTSYSTPATQPTSTNKTTTAQQTAQASSGATQQKATSVAAGTGASVSNPGQGDLYYDPATGRITRNLNGVNYYVDSGDEKYASIYAEAVSRGVVTPASQVQTESAVEVPEYVEPDTSAQMAQLQDLINQLANTKYEPVNVQEQMQNTMTYDQAYNLARSIVEPQYQRTYEETANRAAQNLDKAGLYRSLYGQALSAEAERDVTADMNSAMGQLALDIQNNDWQKAAQTLQMIISEKQYAAGYKQNALSTAAQASINYIDSIVQQASVANDYALQAASLQLQQEANNLEALYTQGQLTQMDLENQLAKLEIQASQAAASSGTTTQNPVSPVAPPPPPPTPTSTSNYALSTVIRNKLNNNMSQDAVLNWLDTVIGKSMGGQTITAEIAAKSWEEAVKSIQ